MARLFSDLVDGSGRRYFYALTSSPGSISPAPAVLRFGEIAPTIFVPDVIFRTPATAVLTLNGMSITGDVILRPNTAALAYGGQIAGLVTSLTISPALPSPSYAAEQDLAPTLLFIQTITPAAALVTLGTLPINITQGGNIGFINPGVGLVSVGGGIPSFVFHQTLTGALTVNGLAPTIIPERTISPEVGSITVNGRAANIDKAFIWIDVDPPPALTWSRVA